MTRKYLLVVPAGHKSLHYSWIEQDRNYDIFVVDYEESDIKSAGEEYRLKAKGKKWELICKALGDDLFLKKYNYIALFDDDLRFTRGALNQLFNLGEILSLDLFQPSIDALTGFQTNWIHLLNVADSDYRWTNLVELMAPVLTPDLFIRSRVALENNPLGWGLDNCFWPSLLKEGQMRAAVIDKVIMEHTRQSQENYSSFPPMLDMTRMIEKLKLRERRNFVYIRNSFHPDLEISEPVNLQSQTDL